MSFVKHKLGHRLLTGLSVCIVLQGNSTEVNYVYTEQCNVTIFGCSVTQAVLSLNFGLVLFFLSVCNS